MRISPPFLGRTALDRHRLPLLSDRSHMRPTSPLIPLFPCVRGHGRRHLRIADPLPILLDGRQRRTTLTARQPTFGPFCCLTTQVGKFIDHPNDTRPLPVLENRCFGLVSAGKCMAGCASFSVHGKSLRRDFIATDRMIRLYLAFGNSCDQDELFRLAKNYSIIMYCVQCMWHTITNDGGESVDSAASLRDGPRLERTGRRTKWRSAKSTRSSWNKHLDNVKR
jgi:hypothetical protein